MLVSMHLLDGVRTFLEPVTCIYQLAANALQVADVSSVDAAHKR